MLTFLYVVLWIVFILLAIWGLVGLVVTIRYIKDELKFFRGENTLISILKQGVTISPFMTHRYHTVHNAIIRILRQVPPCRTGIIKETETASVLNAGITLPCGMCPLYDKEKRLCKGWCGKIKLSKEN